MISDRLFSKLVRAFVRRGSLTVTQETGRRITAGDGTGPAVEVRLLGRGASRLLALDPELHLGELYADGRLILERGTLTELFQLLLRDSRGDRRLLRHPLRRALRGAAQALAPAIGATRARRNVRHHYDLSSAFYDLFLDRERQYSCAYFEHPGQSLDEAQRAKQRHIAAKLLIGPGDHVLDIGSGWGGLGFYLAEIAGAASVTGITLSTEQLDHARREAERRGLAGRVSFEMQDYRAACGRYDRIVSVGMFEHVGSKSYEAFFAALSRLLAPGGVALLHTIGLTCQPGYTNPWIRRHIFPGGHLPSLSEIMPAVERSGLGVTDIEILRLHYADTLAHWGRRFAERREEAARLYDERLCRIWEFYLAGAEACFRWEDLAVFQIQLSRDKDAVPLRRGYIEERERELARRERALATVPGWPAPQRKPRRAAVPARGASGGRASPSSRDAV